MSAITHMHVCTHTHTHTYTKYMHVIWLCAPIWMLQTGMQITHNTHTHTHTHTHAYFFLYGQVVGKVPHGCLDDIRHILASGWRLQQSWVYQHLYSHQTFLLDIWNTQVVQWPHCRWTETAAVMGLSTPVQPAIRPFFCISETHRCHSDITAGELRVQQFYGPCQ